MVMEVPKKRWNSTRGSINQDHYIELECETCHKKFMKEQHKHNLTMKRYPNQKRFFCSLECNYKSRFGHVSSEETKKKISLAQKGISVLARGRPGHLVSDETKQKIRLKKLGNNNGQKHHIIIDKELSLRKISKCALTKGLVPDAIFIEDGKLVALEVEQKKWESDIRQTMQIYDNRNDYDKVILVWYSLDGERLKEWQKENGEWTLTLG